MDTTLIYTLSHLRDSSGVLRPIRLFHTEVGTRLSLLEVRALIGTTGEAGHLQDVIEATIDNRPCPTISIGAMNYLCACVDTDAAKKLWKAVERVSSIVLLGAEQLRIWSTINRLQGSIDNIQHLLSRLDERVKVCEDDHT
jgi:hypothetical protein